MTILPELTPGPVTRPLLRYHGGKWRVANRIIAHFPPHRVYVEPFGGGGSVLLRKPRAAAEVYNDLDGEIVNVFRVARDRGAELRQLVELTPFAREEFDMCFVETSDPLERARRTLFRAAAGFGGNLTRPNRDRSPQRTGFRCYINAREQRRGVSYAMEWANFARVLPALTERLRGVFIEQRHAFEVMERNDAPDALHYVDPPYPHQVRCPDAGGTHRGYRFELSDDEHRSLGTFLSTLKGAVIVSGYACDLYDRELFPTWRRVEIAARADGARARTEILWIKP